MTQTVTHTVAGYDLHLPSRFDEVERLDGDSYSFLRAAITRSITFSVMIAPGGGQGALDGYFETVLQKYVVGTFRTFSLEWMGVPFHGWQLTKCPNLSKHPDAVANFYGTVANGDALCWSWTSVLEPPKDPDAIEYLGLCIVGGAAARKT